MLKRLSAIIPVYNEEESLKDTLLKLKKVLKSIDKLEYEIIVVDDCSTDKSFNILKTIKNIRIVRHKVNRGYGSSLKTGIVRTNHDWILICDADGSYPVNEIPKLVKHIPEYDLIIGQRDRKGIPFMRRFPKYVLRKLASFLSGNKVLDLNSGLRIFRKEIAKEFWKLFPNRFSFTSTMTMACFTHNYNVKYVPISYYPRTGMSSINPIKDTARFFSLLLKLTMYFNPLRFFFPLSAFIISIAFIKGLRDYLVVDHIGALSVSIFIMGFQVFFFGLIADIINKK